MSQSLACGPKSAVRGMANVRTTVGLETHLRRAAGTEALATAWQGCWTLGRAVPRGAVAASEEAAPLPPRTAAIPGPPQHRRCPPAVSAARRACEPAHTHTHSITQIHTNARLALGRLEAVLGERERPTNTTAPPGTRSRQHAACLAFALGSSWQRRCYQRQRPLGGARVCQRPPPAEPSAPASLRRLPAALPSALLAPLRDRARVAGSRGFLPEAWPAAAPTLSGLPAAAVPSMSSSSAPSTDGPSAMRTAFGPSVAPLKDQGRRPALPPPPLHRPSPSSSSPAPAGTSPSPSPTAEPVRALDWRPAAPLLPGGVPAAPAAAQSCSASGRGGLPLAACPATPPAGGRPAPPGDAPLGPVPDARL